MCDSIAHYKLDIRSINNYSEVLTVLNYVIKVNQLKLELQNE